MNKTLRVTLIVVVVLVGALALLWTGAVFGRNLWGMMGGYGYSYGSMGPGMMGGWGFNRGKGNRQCGYGMMGHDMMGSFGGYGMMGSGMMGDFGYGNANSINTEPLSVDETLAVVESYLASFGDIDLAIEEIMIFDNNAYAIIVEESTGIGAFELLVDPVTKAVYPEYGPNMMWNLKYGMHAGSGFGGHGGMMGYFESGSQWDAPDVSAEMTVSAKEVEQIAQDYLDAYAPGVEVSHEITAFYGYYTIDTEKDGKIIGMLSVNGYSGQVFPHTWHGDFIEMSEVH